MVKVVSPAKYKQLEKNFSSHCGKIKNLVIDIFGSDKTWNFYHLNIENYSVKYNDEIGHLYLRVYPFNNEIYAFSCEKKIKKQINDFAKGIEKITGKEVTLYYKKIDNFNT